MNITLHKLTPPNSAAKYTGTKLSADEIELLKLYRQYYNYQKTKPLQWGIKRTMDYSLGFVGFVMSLPINLLASIAIKLESKGPACFKQSRLGKDGKPFIIYKLRTMYNDASKEHGHFNPLNDPRITKVGRKLRKYSIDEFPQFFNMLKGDMSLIGPRPFTEYEHGKSNISQDFLKRYLFKPGAKLAYNSLKCTDIKDRIRVEKDYIENWNLKKDIKILFKIISDIFKGNNC